MINENRVASEYYSFLRKQTKIEDTIMTETKSFADTIKEHGDKVNGSLMKVIKSLSHKEHRAGIRC